MGKINSQRIRLHPDLCKFLKIKSITLNKKQTHLLPNDIEKKYLRFKIE